MSQVTVTAATTAHRSVGRAAVARLGTVLGVWAHPDDETYCSGGLMAYARANGQRVVCVSATRGEQGRPDDTWSLDRTARLREQELRAALDRLGVREHRWLGHRDGELDTLDDGEAAAPVAALVDEIRPDTILTFGPDGYTGHPDHRAVSHWVDVAVAATAAPAPRVLHVTNTASFFARWAALHDRFEVFQPGFPWHRGDVATLAVHLELDEWALGRKRDALAAQASQTEGLVSAVGEHDYRAWVVAECFVERPA